MEQDKSNDMGIGNILFYLLANVEHELSEAKRKLRYAQNVRLNAKNHPGTPAERLAPEAIKKINAEVEQHYSMFLHYCKMLPDVLTEDGVPQQGVTPNSNPYSSN